MEVLEMSEMVRFGISMQKELLEMFDTQLWHAVMQTAPKQSRFNPQPPGRTGMARRQCEVAAPSHLFMTIIRAV